MILYHSVDHIMLKEEREGEWGERVSKFSYDKKSVDMAETLMVSNPLFGLFLPFLEGTFTSSFIILTYNK